MTWNQTVLIFKLHTVVVMPQIILPQRNRRCAISATGTKWEKDARGVSCFMEENEINLREVARFDEHKETNFEVEKGSILLMSNWWTSISSFCKLSELTSA